MINKLGDRIKKRRETLNIQTNDLANSIGVTSSLISQIERTKAFPSIITLKKIAEALYTTVGELIGENETFIKKPLLKAAERKFAKQNKNGASTYLLSHHDPLKQMDTFVINFEPNANSREIMTTNNPGQEFCFVLKGNFEVVLNAKKYKLNEGDSFYFISNQPHLFTNINDAQAQLLWVVNQKNT